MSYNDSSIFMGQGPVYLQRRLRNGLPLGAFNYVSDCNKFNINLKQSFDAVAESESGFLLTKAKPVTRTEASIDMNFLDWKKENLEIALQGTDTGAVASGTESAGIYTAYNNGVGAAANGAYNLDHIGTSAEVIKLAGTTTHVASISISAAGSGYAANTAFPMTLTTSVGQTAVAYSNAAGAIVGVILSGTGTTLATAASITTPGGGSGATFVIHAGQTSLVLNTDYTVNSQYGQVTILPGSILVPAFGYTVADPADGTAGRVSLTNAYSYAAYTGNVEAFTTGIAYFTARLNGFNTVNGQPTVALVYQFQMEMTKVLGLIDSKHGDLALTGEILIDTTRPAPTPALPYSQILTITKG